MLFKKCDDNDDRHHRCQGHIQQGDAPLAEAPPVRARGNRLSDRRRGRRDCLAPPERQPDRTSELFFDLVVCWCHPLPRRNPIATSRRSNTSASEPINSQQDGSAIVARVIRFTLALCIRCTREIVRTRRVLGAIVREGAGQLDKALLQRPGRLKHSD